jgi:hypothetical protein
VSRCRTILPIPEWAAYSLLGGPLAACRASEPRWVHRQLAFRTLPAPSSSGQTAPSTPRTSSISWPTHTAHSLAYLRIDGNVAATAARLDTDAERLSPSSDGFGTEGTRWTTNKDFMKSSRSPVLLDPHCLVAPLGRPAPDPIGRPLTLLRTVRSVGPWDASTTAGTPRPDVDRRPTFAGNDH